MTEFPVDSEAIAPAATAQTRPMYWSVRRELWENRSIYVAPLAVAAVILFGFLISAIGLPHRRRATLLLPAAQQQAAIEKPYDIAAGMMLLTAFVVGIFYCADALYGERRDRTILFWKSMPVSDRSTVLSKAAVPLVILPLITFALIVILQVLILLLTTLVLLGGAPDVALSTRLPFLSMWIAVLYTMIVAPLWHAPIYAWLLLVSGWARRAVLLWAVLPFIAIGILERIAFNTSYFGQLMQYRLIGWFTQAFIVPQKGAPPLPDPLDALTPGRFLSTPGLWIGLVVAAAFLVLAVRMRRYRDPI